MWIVVLLPSHLHTTIEHQQTAHPYRTLAHTYTLAATFHLYFIAKRLWIRLCTKLIQIEKACSISKYDDINCHGRRWCRMRILLSKCLEVWAWADGRNPEFYIYRAQIWPNWIRDQGRIGYQLPISCILSTCLASWDLLIRRTHVDTIHETSNMAHHISVRKQVPA